MDPYPSSILLIVLQVKTMTTAKPVSDFMPFAEAATPAERSIYRPYIAVYLATLAQCTDASNIERVTLDQVAKISERWTSENSANKGCTFHRKAIAAWQQTTTLDDSNSTESTSQQVAAGYSHNGRTHLAIPLMTLGKERHQERNRVYRDKRETQRRECRPIQVFAAIKAAEAALKSNDVFEVEAGFTFLTGRRPIEVTRRQGFTVTGRHTIEFSGQAKRKGAAAEPAYTIYCLCDSNLVIDAIAKMNSSPEFKEIDKITSNESAGFKIHPKLGRRTRAIFGEMIPAATGRDQLTPSALRAAYTVAAMALFKPASISPSAFAQDLLGHINPEESLSYEDYYAASNSGEELPTGMWRDRLLEPAPAADSKKRSSVTLSAEFRQRIADTVDGETHTERLEAMYAAYFEVKSLRRKLAEAERRANHELPEPTPAPVAQPDEQRNSRIDYGSMASDELRGSQAPGSAGEKIRRAMAAIVEWNSGRESAAMYRLSSANLRKVSGARHNSVVAWIEANQAEIDAYNNAHNLTGAMHDRGKQPIEQVIGW